MTNLIMNCDGPQHPVLPERMCELYKQLYELLPDSLDKSTLSAYFPAKGSEYGKSDIRIMLVGRCTNGWYGLTSRSADEFVTSASNSIILGDGFGWIDSNDHTNDHISTYEENGQTKTYNLHRSAFWRVSKMVTVSAKPWVSAMEKLGYKMSDDEIVLFEKANPRWFEHIAWTNLFPIAPKNTGNTSEKLKKLLKNTCGELLKEQIEYYRPTHILFITDWDYWFSDVAEFFPDVHKTNASAEDDIVGKGTINGIKTVVVKRPEARSNMKMSQAIVSELFGV